MRPGSRRPRRLRAVVATGQPGYGMAGRRRRTRCRPAPALIIARRRQGRRAAALGARMGRREHARAGAAARARDAHARSSSGVRLQAARLHHLRSGRCRSVDPARVSRRCTTSRMPSTPDGEQYYLRHLDRHQRRSLLPQRRRRRLHDVHRRRGWTRTSAARDRSASVYIHPVLHPRGRHAVVPRADQQRPRQRDEPVVRRLGRPLRVASVLRRDAAVLDAGRRLVSRPRQLARYGRRDSTASRTRRIQATIWRWRRAFQHDFAARMDWTVKDVAPRQSQPARRRERPAPAGAGDDRRAKSARRVALDAAGTSDPGRQRAALLVVLLSRSRHRHPGPAGRRRAARVPDWRRRQRATRAAFLRPPPAAPPQPPARVDARDATRRAGDGDSAGAGHRARDPRGRGRRSAAPDVVPAGDPEHRDASPIVLVRRGRAVLAGLVLLTSCGSPAREPATNPAASARSAPEIVLTLIGRYVSGAPLNTSGADIRGVRRSSRRLFVVNVFARQIDIVDLTSPPNQRAWERSICAGWVTMPTASLFTTAWWPSRSRPRPRRRPGLSRSSTREARCCRTCASARSPTWSRSRRTAAGCSSRTKARPATTTASTRGVGQRHRPSERRSQPRAGERAYRRVRRLRLECTRPKHPHLRPARDGGAGSGARVHHRLRRLDERRG